MPVSSLTTDTTWRSSIFLNNKQQQQQQTTTTVRQMGGEQSSFAGYDLAELEYCTFLSKPEIVHVHKVFSAIARKHGKAADRVLTMAEVLTLNELKFNPYSKRICQVNAICDILHINFALTLHLQCPAPSSKHAVAGCVIFLSIYRTNIG
jgi:hypothetical protein